MKLRINEDVDTQNYQYSQMIESPAFKDVSVNLSKIGGYVLDELYVENGRLHFEAFVIANNEPYAKYLSNIRYDWRSNEFKAQTTSYGNLTNSEYAMFAMAVSITRKTLNYLNSLDFDNIDVINFDKLGE